MKLFYIMSQQLATEGDVISSPAPEGGSPPVISSNQIDWKKSEFHMPFMGAVKVSSGFGAIRSNGKTHTGVDFSLDEGRVVYPVGYGTVVKAGSKSGHYNGGTGSEGNFVVIDHGNGLHTNYYHLSKVTCKVGDKVGPDTKIGNSGNTGNSTGPHLHLEFLLNKVPQAFSAKDLITK